MAKTEYDWEVGGPATLAPHSQAKHTILRRYVEEYIQTLLSDPRVPELRLTLIDGFAGGGEYIVEGQSGIHLGSPFVLMEAVKAGEALANQAREKPRPVKASFIFVEKKHSNYRYLEDAIARRLDEAARARVKLIHGAFEDWVDRIIQDVQSARGRKPRCIFVLDQYGYTDVPVDLLAKIMNALPTSEIFLTLAYGWIGAYARSPEAQALRIQRSLRIAPHLEGFADGTREVEEIASLSPGDKNAAMRFVQQMLHEAFAKRSGATCYTPFFITSRGSNRSYWFLHLANSPTANDVVKKLHWEVKNHFVHYGGSGLMMLGYDPARPQDDTQQRAFAFDKSAEERTMEALLEELPRRIQAEFPDGISFGDLYARICNETPASKDILRAPIEQLCRDLELEKRGAQGEERAPGTKLKDSDRIRLRSQIAFSFIKPR